MEVQRGWVVAGIRTRERAGAGSVTLAVSDLEDQIEKMRRLGIEAKRPMASSRMKVVMVKDPDGNSIAFAETAQ